MFSVPLSAEAVSLLVELAARTGVSPEEFARRAILDRMEDTEDFLAAAERLQSSDGQMVSVGEAMARQQAMAVAATAFEQPNQAFVDAVSEWPDR